MQVTQPFKMKFETKTSDPYLQTAKDALKATFAHPSVSRAHLQSSKNCYQLSSFWNQPVVSTGRQLWFEKSFSLKKDDLSVISDGFPIPCAQDQMSAFAGDLKVVVTKDGNSEFILDVWKKGNVWKSFNLTSRDLHGEVYLDVEFGGLAINEAANKVAYIAEKKAPKSVPFFKASNGAESLTGQEFLYRDDWGEQMNGKKCQVIVVFDLEKEEPELWDCCPVGWLPGQLVWYKEALFGIATLEQPFKLGIKFCSNRPSSVFRTSGPNDFSFVKESKATNCRHPRISATAGVMVYLERDLTKGNNYPGPHQAGFKLMKVDLEAAILKPECVVEAVNATDGDFAGVYGNTPLPRRCFNKDGNKLIASFPVLNVLYPVTFDLTSGGVTVHKTSPNISILGVFEDVLVGVHSTLLQPPAIVVAKLNTDLTFTRVTESAPLSALSIASTLHTPSCIHPEPRFHHVTFNSLYVGPSSGDPASVPLIVLPHGGPHAVVNNSFLPNIDFFLRLGFAWLVVNFRGSLGAGDDSVFSLVGQVGVQDVADCDQARRECLAARPHLDPDRVVLFGGSHGGFLIAHLIGQFPGDFRAAVSRNGVYNTATKSSNTDIPESAAVSMGRPYSFEPFGSETLTKMYNRSPIQYADSVRCPVLLAVGTSDRRVSPSQSIEYYRALKAKGKDVFMLRYDDCHSLTKTSTVINVLVNAAMFFHKALN